MYPHLFAGIEINPNLIAILVTYFIAMISIVMMSIILMKHYRLQQDKLSELANQLQEVAHLDPLTHIYNRRYLVEYLNIFLFSSLSVSIPASTISLYDISL